MGAPVIRASSGRAAWQPRALAQQLDLEAGARQVAVGEQADESASRERRPQGGERVALAGQRDDLHAERCPVGDEAVEE